MKRQQRKHANRVGFLFDKVIMEGKRLVQGVESLSVNAGSALRMASTGSRQSMKDVSGTLPGASGSWHQRCYGSVEQTSTGAQRHLSRTGGFRHMTPLSRRFPHRMEAVLFFTVVVRFRNNIWHLVGTK